MRFEQAVLPPSGPRARLRQAVRGGVLAAQARLTPPKPQARFLRCLYSHYVFDDQRAAFETHLKTFKRLGEFVTTAQMLELLRGEVPLDGRYFHLSYDDGLGCLAENAVPILAEYDIPAIVFVNPGVIGTPAPEVKAAWDRAVNYRSPQLVMDWASLRASGLEVGAHTTHHRRLSDISDDADMLRSEVAGCKAMIEAQMGRPCRYFAWPYGTMADVDAASLAAIRAAGYDAAFGVYRVPIVPGQTPPLMIPRHHFEPQWPAREVGFFAQGGRERAIEFPAWAWA